MEACNAHGIYCVRLYDTLGAGAIEFILCHAEVEIAFAEEKKVAELLKTFPKSTEFLKTIVSFGKLTQEQKEEVSKYGLSIYSWDELLSLGQFRGRPEVTDQREKYLQRLQQVQQQQGNLLNASHITGINQKQFPTQQPNSLLQQFNSQSSSISSQGGLGLGVQGPDAGQTKSDEQQGLADDAGVESAATTGPIKHTNEDDTKAPYSNPPASIAEGTQLSRDTDLSPGQPMQPGMPSSGVGVIGRRSVSDFGAIGDNLSGASVVSGHDHLYNLQMLEAAYHRLPQPKDSERAKTYIPRHPSVTPASYPQIQAPIVTNPAFWERLGSDTLSTDMLFFAFYYQQNSYQQYLAAKELKKQSWRFHRKYNTWFQRHVEPQVTTDEYERGSYVYFDFHLADDGNGWCQRIKNDFTFEYNFLEDELSVQPN